MGIEDWKMAEVEFVLVRVRPSPLTASLSFLAQVVDLSSKAEATLDTIFSSLVFAYFAAPLKVQDQEKRRMGLVSEIEGSIGSDVALLHGSRRWLIGTYGGTDRFHYGAMGPEISELIGKVLEMNMGEIQEV